MGSNNNNNNDMARQLFTQTLNILKDSPNDYVNFGERFGLVDEQKHLYTADRYWWSIVLNDTPYTQGDQTLAGCTSRHDLKRARYE